MKKDNKKGFTLIEMIIVIAIIAVLLLIIVPTMNGFINTARREANQANAKAIYTAVVAQHTAHTAGLKDSAGTVYGDVANGDTELNADFYEGSIPSDCAITLDEGVYSVTCNGGDTNLAETYPAN